MKLYDNDAYRDEFMALVYNLLQSDGTNDRANQIIDAFDRATEIEAEPIPDNGPLTMNELREMDGEPVWVCGLCDSTESGWHILERTGPTNTRQVLHYESFGRTWFAYRHKPEEGTYNA